MVYAAMGSFPAFSSPYRLAPRKSRMRTVGFTHMRSCLTKKEECGLLVPPDIHVAIDLCLNFGICIVVVARKSVCAVVQWLK